MRLLAFIILGFLLLDLFSSSEAWWWSQRRSRRTRSCNARSTSNWFSRYDQPFTFTCPSGQAMTEIHSIYSCHYDRVFKFACKRNPAAKGRCHWSHYVNDWDQVLAFKCPYNGFITGISSYHRNDKEDRRFMFRCCADSRFHRLHCSSGSHFVNEWKKPLNFRAPRKHFLVGAISYHDNGQEDRRWKFETCKVARPNTHGWRSRYKKAKKN